MRPGQGAGLVGYFQGTLEVGDRALHVAAEGGGTRQDEQGAPGFLLPVQGLLRHLLRSGGVAGSQQRLRVVERGRLPGIGCAHHLRGGLGGELDLLRVLALLAHVQVVEHVAVGVLQADRVLVGLELEQLPVEVEREDEAFLLRPVHGGAAGGLGGGVAGIDLARLDGADQRLVHQQHDVALEAVVHGRRLHAQLQHLQAAHGGAALQGQGIEDEVQVGVADLVHGDGAAGRRHHQEVVGAVVAGVDLAGRGQRLQVDGHVPSGIAGDGQAQVGVGAQDHLRDGGRELLGEGVEVRLVLLVDGVQPRRLVEALEHGHEAQHVAGVGRQVGFPHDGLQLRGLA